MFRTTRLFYAAIAFGLACHAFVPSSNFASKNLRADEATDFFERKVRPLLVEHCFECHSGTAKKLQAGLRLDSRSHSLAGGDSGPALVPGKPNESLIVQAVRYDGYEMPPRSKLPPEQIAIFEKWVELGAIWPEDPNQSTVPGDSSTPKPFDLVERRQAHWCWQPLQQVALADHENVAPSTTPIDRFIDNALCDAALKPAESATLEEWGRRVALDVTGLFPEPQDLERLLHDTRPDAKRRYVDRLLANPACGEHWARYWLDVVRYAETRGHEFDPDIRGARHYRDYVIRALNQDLPYAQFAVEQIAGDLIESPRIDPVTGINESVVATGFWHLGEWVHSPVDTARDESDRVDNMIDTFSKTFLGVTVACARCHDHKFDAISTDDYYALATILKCSEFREARFKSEHTNRTIAKELQQLQTAWQQPLKLSLAEIATAELERLKTAEALDAPYTQIGFIQRAHRVLQPRDATIDAPMQWHQDHPWLVDGEVFGAGPLPAGWFSLSGKDPLQLELSIAQVARRDDFWNELRDTPDPLVDMRSRLDSFPRSSRTWRTETFELKTKELHYFVRGSGTAFVCIDSHRQIFGPLHGGTVFEFRPPDGHDPQEPYWVRHGLERYEGCWTHVEITPKDTLPLEILAIVPTRPAPNEDPAKNAKSIELAAATEALTQVVRALRDEAPWTQSTLKLGAWWVAELPQWSPRHAKELEAFQNELTKWKRERERLQARIIKESPLAPAMWDGTEQPGWVSIRGNPHANGRLAPRRNLTALGGEEAKSSGSGRDQLAANVIASDNPLTWRVMSNRVWQQCMGRGIVASPDDFGILGERPTHPALLEYLAIRLRDHGSIKTLVRELLKSDAYGRSCRPQADALANDPENRQWHYRPPRRMTGEMVRDVMLQQSDRLVRSSPGPSVPLHLTEFMDGRGRPAKSGPVDGNGHRSIYLALRRNFLSPMLVAFDLPSPTVTRGRRSLSNVPTQALAMLNDPLIQQLSELKGLHASQSLDRVPPSTESDSLALEALVAQLMTEAFGYRPSDEALQDAMEFVKEDAKKRGQPAALGALTHVLWNTKAFLFIP